MSKEEFLMKVQSLKSYTQWTAIIQIKGREHKANGKTQIEAEDNLWEYLISDINLF
jgi:hypothetical protein